MAYNPDAIVLMQQLERTTRTAIARSANITASSFSKALNKQTVLKVQTVENLGKNFDYPLSFFERSLASIPVLDLTYRHTSKSSVSELNAVAAEYSLLTDIVQNLTQRMHFQPRTDWIDSLAPKQYRITPDDINNIAEQARLILHIGKSGVVGNVTRSLERCGIVVAPLHSMGYQADSSYLTSDGVTYPHANTANRVIGYRNTDSAGDRERFTKAHELGHLILHRYRIPDQYRDAEREAHLFAGAFLMPRQDALQVFNSSTMLSEFPKIKSQWGMSIASLITRGADVGAYNAERKRSLFIQLSVRGWRKQEPVEVGKEHPLLLKQMIEKAYGDSKHHVDAFSIENDLAVPFRYIDKWTDGITEQGSEFGFIAPRFDARNN